MSVPLPARRSVPLFRTERRLWTAFLTLNVLVAPALALIAYFVGRPFGNVVIFWMSWIGSALILIANFVIWVSARRIRMPYHAWIATWTVLCLFTLMLLAAASPVIPVLAYLGLPMGNLHGCGWVVSPEEAALCKESRP